MIYLTDNQILVKKLHIEETSKSMGKLLGYCYTDRDFGNTKIERISVSPIAVHNDGHIVELFHTVVPKQNIERNDVKLCFDEQVIDFNNVLNKFGYKVYLKYRMKIF